MMLDTAEWLHVPCNLYADYTSEDQLPKAMVELIDKYTFVFNDQWWYWRVKPRKKADRNKKVHIIKRCPLWTYPKKSVDAEKPNDPFQLKLIVVQEETGKEKQK